MHRHRLRGIFDRRRRRELAARPASDFADRDGCGSCSGCVVASQAEDRIEQAHRARMRNQLARSAPWSARHDGDAQRCGRAEARAVTVVARRVRASAASSGRPRPAGLLARSASSPASRHRGRSRLRPARASPRSAANVRSVGSGASTSATPKRRPIGRTACQRLRIGLVVGDQRDRLAIDRDLRCRFEQARRRSSHRTRTGSSTARASRSRCSSSRPARCGPSCESASARSRGRRTPASRRSRARSRRRRRTT